MFVCGMRCGFDVLVGVKRYVGESEARTIAIICNLNTLSLIASLARGSHMM